MLKTSMLYSQRSLPKAFGAALLGLVIASSSFTAQAGEDDIAALQAQSAKPLAENTDAELAEVLRKAIEADSAVDNTEVSSNSLLSSALTEVARGNNTTTNRQSAVPLFVFNAVSEDVDNASELTLTAFQNAGFSEYDDRASVAAAITANAVCGARHALPADTAFKPVLKRIVTQAVKRATGNDGPNINTPSGATSKPARGAAAAATGAVSQVAGQAASEASNLAIAVIKAAVKSQPKFFKEIAQATTTALAAISELTGGSAEDFKIRSIKIAVQQALRSRGRFVSPRTIAKFVKFGRDEAARGGKGAGAKGVRDYAHNNCNDKAVTDVTGF